MDKFQAQTIKVAVTCKGGGVSIMSLVIVGRGNSLPSYATWIDREKGIWTRDVNESVLAEEVSRAVPDALGYRIIDESEIPKDRTFRDALKDDGKSLGYEMAKARDIVRQNIRHTRASAMPLLDNKWMRAIGQGKKFDADAIENDRQRWRDAPADPRIDSSANVEELKPLMPES